MIKDTLWTQENISKLRTLHEAKLTASQIAKQFGQHVSRNAIIGKLFRLGLSKTKPPEWADGEAPERKSRAQPVRSTPSLPPIKGQNQK